MEIRNLLDKLKSLESQLQEAEADDLAAYQRGKAAQDRLNAIEEIKKLAAIPLNQIPRLGNAIDPKTGILYYGEAGMDSSIGSARKYPFKWFGPTGPGETRQFGEFLKMAGLEVVPHTEKTLFGTAEYAKVDPAKLSQVLSGTAAQASTTQQPAGPDISAKLAKLKELIKQYNTAKTAGKTNPEVKATESQQPVNQVTQNQDGTFTMVKPDGSKVVFDVNGKTLSEGTLSLSEKLLKEMAEAELSGSQLGTAAAAGATKYGLQKTADKIAAADLAKYGLEKTGDKIAASTAASTGLKTATKTAAKVVPGVGTTLSAIDAYNRWQEGDRTGAVISTLAGIGWLVPGPMGWALGGGLDAANIGRDLARAKESVEDEISTRPLPSLNVPTTEAEHISYLRKQLESLEEKALEEAISSGAIAKGASYADDILKWGKDTASRLWGKVQDFRKGVQSPNVTPLPNAGAAKNVKYKGPSSAFKAGQMVGRNPKKTVAGAVAAGGLTGYLAGRDSDSDIAGKTADGTPPTTAADFQRTDKDTTPVPVPSRPRPPAAAPAPAPAPAQVPAGPDLEGLKGQIRQLTGEIKGSGVSNQDVSDTVKQAEEILQMSVAPIKS